MVVVIVLMCGCFWFCSCLRCCFACCLFGALVGCLGWIFVGFCGGCWLLV